MLEPGSIQICSAPQLFAVPGSSRHHPHADVIRPPINPHQASQTTPARLENQVPSIGSRKTGENSGKQSALKRAHLPPCTCV
eukprot:365126-Chlamydomonas_euryale.AAC.48